MGGSVNTGGQNQNQTSVTTPWAPAVGLVSGILGNLSSVSPFTSPTESSALATLSGIGAAGNPFTGGISNVANTLLSGGGPDRTGLVNDAYTQYQKALQPFATGAYVDPSSNPELQKYLSTIQTDVTNNVNSQFAAAGRDFSGMNTQTLARGIAQGEAPVLANEYDTARGQQINAINSLYGAGNTTGGILSQLDQIRLGNMTAGVNVAGDAWNGQQSGPILQLQAEAQRRGIPLQTLAAEMGIALPAGQAFGATNQTGQTQNTTPLWQNILGGVVGGAGILGGMGAFGKNGWLNFGKGS